MQVSVMRQIAELDGMTVGQLRAKYAEVFGEPAFSHNKSFLRKRVCWRLQAQAEGGLPERARQRAMELANDADIRLNPPKAPGGLLRHQTIVGTVSAPQDSRLPMAGSVITRQYKGKTVAVLVREDGFEYEGALFNSLTAIATHITGSHWNGYGFFGLGVKQTQKVQRSTV